MKGRKPFEYRLRDADRHYLNEVVVDGQLIQRVANRARALLALDRGERIVEIGRWLGVFPSSPCSGDRSSAASLSINGMGR